MTRTGEVNTDQLPIAREEWDELVAGDMPQRRSTDEDEHGIPDLRVLVLCILGGWLVLVGLIWLGWEIFK